MPLTTEENDILWKLHEDHMIHARHEQTLRATTTTILLAIAAGLSGFLGTEHTWPPGLTSLPSAAFLMLLGIFGILFSAKYHERYRFHVYRADQYLETLDASLPAAGIKSARSAADIKSAAKAKLLTRIYSSHLWMGLHALVFLLGCILAIFILVHHFSTAPPAQGTHAGRPIF